MNIDEVINILTGEKTARSKQYAIGPSEIGGCRRRVWHRLQQTPVTNPDTLRLAAWMGTSLHTAIERRFDQVDPFQQRYLREVKVSANGMTGHVDCYDKQDKEVIDWKTVTKKSLRYFPSAQNRSQVHLYGFMLNANGYPVETVTLVAIARDGNENDVRLVSEPYDEKVALHGFGWLEDIKAATVAPAPEMKRSTFCEPYCPYFDSTGKVGCVGS